MADLTVEDIHKDWQQATEGLAQWRTETKESYDFASGHQWEADVLAQLEEEERPAITFDRTGVFIDAVSGMEINNRQAIKFLPVEQGDIRVNEVLTQTAKYYENDCSAEDEDSEAVRDAVICGIGCTETMMHYEKNPEGAPIVVRRDPLSVWYDPTANRRNLSDGRFVFHGDWMAKDEALARWPGATLSGEPPDNVPRPHMGDRAFMYRENATDTEHQGQVFVLQYQCWKLREVLRLRDPHTGKLVDLTPTQFRAAADIFEMTLGRAPAEKQDYVKTRKKAYYRAFLSGAEILEQDELEVKDFTVKFITYKRDRNQRMWYGLVRSMKDPQRFANKWLSSITHMLNTNAKGGAFAEVNAFVDPRKAEEDWARPNPLLLMKEGAVSGHKIQERSQAQFPSGMDRMMLFAFNSMPFVTGLNLEVLGLADRDQAGVLEAQRRQSAFGILAPLFSAIREYRKARGKLLLAFIQTFVPAGTLVRIVGSAGEQYVPLAKDSLTYDVKVDQAPDSLDYKKQVWDALGQIIPPMMKAGYPVPPEVLNFSPLPSDISEKWVTWIKEQGWMPPERRQQMEQMGTQLQSLGQENMQLKEQNMMMRLDHSAEMSKIQTKTMDSHARNEIKVYQTQMEHINRRIDAFVQQQDAMLKSALQAQKQFFERETKVIEAQAEQRVKTANLAAEQRVRGAQDSMQALMTTKAARKMKIKTPSGSAYEVEFEEATKH